jgi:hypothetical protein
MGDTSSERATQELPPDIGKALCDLIDKGALEYQKRKGYKYLHIN